MPNLSKRIMEHAELHPEAMPLYADALLHSGKRTAINRALSRLASSKTLLRICRGIYMRPVMTRFGIRPPFAERAVEALAKLWGETVVPCGASAANVLGLTTQNPVILVYFTSGPDRQLYFGGQQVRLRHVPRWQLVAPYRPAGTAVRALAWLGPLEVEDALKRIADELSADDRAELNSARSVIPAWMAEPVKAMIANG